MEYDQKIEQALGKLFEELGIEPIGEKFIMFNDARRAMNDIVYDEVLENECEEYHGNCRCSCDICEDCKEN